MSFGIQSTYLHIYAYIWHIYTYVCTHKSDLVFLSFPSHQYTPSKKKMYLEVYRILISDRSRQRRYSVRKAVLRNFVKLTGKQLFQSLFFNKVAGLRLWHRGFPVNFAIFLRTPFSQNISGRLPLCRSVSVNKKWLL